MRRVPLGRTMRLMKRWPRNETGGNEMTHALNQLEADRIDSLDRKRRPIAVACALAISIAAVVVLALAFASTRPGVRLLGQ